MLYSGQDRIIKLPPTGCSKLITSKITQSVKNLSMTVPRKKRPVLMKIDLLRLDHEIFSLNERLYEEKRC